jgi:DNA-directed RNA polymerase specialized sigma subunit
MRDTIMNCADCGGKKSTLKTIRCWDCSLVQKKSLRQKGNLVRADAILAKRAAGMKMTEIAAELGVSRQRVYQVLDKAGKKVG